MSDEIHPNMAGHQQIAQSLARSITGRSISLADIPPPAPAVPRTLSRLAAKAPVKVLAMPPLDMLIGPALKELDPGAELEISTWLTVDKTLVELEQDARARVRTFRPDLVLLSVPRSARSESQESFVRSYAWIMNWSLSFGAQEWDCVVVHPSLLDPDHPDPEHDQLIRRLVRAQDLTLIDRPAMDGRSAADLLIEWLGGQLRQTQ